METLGQRILRRRKQLNLTQTEIAKKLKGITHTAVSYWESDKAVPNATNLYELSVVLNCSVSWLLNGIDDSHFQVGNSLKSFGNKYFKQLPFLSDEQIISCNFDNADDFIVDNRENTSRKSFAYKITNNAMSPIFNLDDVVIIDPDKQLETDYFVLAKVSNNIVLRKLIVTGLSEDNVIQFTLLPQNKDYPTSSSEKNNIEIIGVVVEHRNYQLRR